MPSLRGRILRITCLQKGYIKSRNEAFDRYIGSNGPCYVPRKKMPCAEAIRLIKNARAVFQSLHTLFYTTSEKNR